MGHECQSKNPDGTPMTPEKCSDFEDMELDCYTGECVVQVFAFIVELVIFVAGIVIACYAGWWAILVLAILAVVSYLVSALLSAMGITGMWETIIGWF